MKQYWKLFPATLTPLNEEQSKKCEDALTEQECYQALKHMDSGKSPGSDGFTCEFYKFFWDYVKQNVVESINYGFEKRKLSICQRRSILTLVPKKDKPTNLLGNLRPISLLNTDYKIATKAIAKRLEAVLPLVINADQTGYIKGRYIGENVRLIRLHRSKKPPRSSYISSSTSKGHLIP